MEEGSALSSAQKTETGVSDPHWQRNLWVCVFGSFTTIAAMTQLQPFLPLYVEELGVRDPAAIVQWSGVAYGAMFLSAGLVAPLWGHLADRYGRKLMLVRASLGMAVSVSLIGLSDSIWHLVLLRLLAGLLGGYASGSMVLVATQTPRDRTGWALGTLSAGIMAGNLVGPLVGGMLPPLVGIRNTFFLAGAVIFVSFLATLFLVKEDPRPPWAKDAAGGGHAGGGWKAVPDKRPVLAMLVTGMLLLLANMSIEPIITVYVQQFVPRADQVTLVSGVVMAAGALGSILSASRLGRLADRAGHWNVVVGGLLASGLLLLPQAFVTASWQLIGLRFLMGLSLGGLLPCIAAVIRRSVPGGIAGQVLGYSISAQYAGQVIGPLFGGFVGGRLGMRAVFLCTSALMIAGAALNWQAGAKARRARADTGPRH